MKSLDVRDPMFPDCPVRNVLARVGDKWSLLVMHEMERAALPLRFSALQKGIPDISKKMLTTTLRSLEEDGLVVRTIYAEVPPRVEYALTPCGVSFMAACRPMIEWSMANLASIVKHRTAFRAKKV